NHYEPYCLSTSPFTTPPTTAPYTLSLHDALPISRPEQRAQNREVHEHRRDARDHTDRVGVRDRRRQHDHDQQEKTHPDTVGMVRSEEHTSELQSHLNLVCRLLLEKKK